MQKNHTTPPCCNITECGEAYLRNSLSQLLALRIEEKCERLTMLYEKSGKRWNEALFRLLARSFGFGIQSNVFEEWATLLNIQALGKHSDNIEQIEAIFFGQAGLLCEESKMRFMFRGYAANSLFRLARNFLAKIYANRCFIHKF